METFHFGYDLDNIINVMQHVEENYTESEYIMHIERGDDVMHMLA